MACRNHSAPPFLQCMVILEVIGGLGFGLLLQTLFRLFPDYVRFFFLIHHYVVLLDPFRELYLGIYLGIYLLKFRPPSSQSDSLYNITDGRVWFRYIYILMSNIPSVKCQS